MAAPVRIQRFSKVLEHHRGAAMHFVDYEHFDVALKTPVTDRTAATTVFRLRTCSKVFVTRYRPLVAAACQSRVPSLANSVMS